MRKRFTTYIEEDSIAWIKRKALEREIKKGKKASAADILNELIEKEKAMNLTHKDLCFAHAATNGELDHSDLELESDGVKYLIRNTPSLSWDGESDWTDDDDYIDRIVKERVAANEYEVFADGEWQSAE